MTAAEHPDEPIDSPVDWVADHAKRYAESGGTEGHYWRGLPTCLLTTVGRRTGLRRRMPLLYGQDGDRIIVVASRGGSDQSPQWLSNLLANPEVEVMVGERSFHARATVATGEERKRLWQLMLEVYPRYEVYQTRTKRQIAVVVLTPVGS